MSDVVVIGGGAVGTSVALGLARRGAAVTLLERGPTVAAGCSAGNAGVVGAAQVVPLASPDALREGVASLLRRHAPFALKARPEIVPWLARFAAAARPARHAASAAVLRRLAVRSAELHEALGTSFDIGYVREGFLAAYEDRDQLAAASEAAPLGELVDAATLHAQQPALANGLRGGILFPHEAHVDPGRLVGALAGELERLGGRVRLGVEVVGIHARGRRVGSLSTTDGDLACGAVVVATGAWSPQLARALGTRIPVQGGKGYSVEYDGASELRHPVYFPERRIVLTPLGDRVRLTGMLELCGTDLTVDQVRVETIRRQAVRFMPALARMRTTRLWRGLRPCTPDGLPIVGRVPRFDNAWLATGHGMWGLQLAPVTGELLAPAVAGEPEDELLAPLHPARFGRCRARQIRRTGSSS